jgi:hypothetical protein
MMVKESVTRFFALFSHFFQNSRQLTEGFLYFWGGENLVQRLYSKRNMLYGVDYNLTLCRLQTVTHVPWQPYARVNFIPQVRD